MQKLKPQFMRWLFIDRKLREGCYPNCSSLAREYEVSNKTFQRDIEYLKYQLDAPIEYDSSRKGYYYAENSYRLPAINILESELFALFLAEKVLKQYENTPLYEKMVSIFKKIEQFLPDNVSIDPCLIETSFSVFHEPAPAINQEVWTRVFESLRTNKELLFSYRAPGYSDCVERVLRPYHVVSYRSEWYVIGFCEHAKAIRIYAISRILKAELSDSSYKIPNDFNFDDFIGSHFGIFRSDKNYKVKIQFAPYQAPYIKERVWHESQHIVEQEDGSILLTFTTNHLFEVKRWVLSYGSAALVIEPEELKKMIKEDIHKIGSAYS